MKLVAAAFSFLIFTAISLSITYAQTPTPNASIRAARVAGKLDNLLERAASREAALKAKLLKFKDQNKAQIVERVNTNLAKVNKNRTDMMLAHLDRMSTISSKLTDRVNSITDKDTTSAKSQIASASAAIATAREAVASQSAKDYTISVTTETNVRKDAQATRELLHTDLRSVHQLIVAARQALAKAISETAQLVGIKNGQ